MRRKAIVYYVTAWFCCAVLLSGCSHWREAYLDDSLENATQEDVKAKLGPPHRTKQVLLNDETIWTYRYALDESDLKPMHSETFGRGLSDLAESVAALIGKPPDQGAARAKVVCVEYYLTFDKSHVLQKWTRELCSRSAQEES